MSKKSIAAIIAILVVVSTISVFALIHFQSTANPKQNSITTSTQFVQSTNQGSVQSYTGYLVSYNYTDSPTNGVESTQLVFTNKTFNYAGYISLDNNFAYNVTYYENNPNQALNITEMELTIGFMGNAEQASITNVVLSNVGTGAAKVQQVAVTVQNTGSATVTISSGFHRCKRSNCQHYSRRNGSINSHY